MDDAKSFPIKCQRNKTRKSNLLKKVWLSSPTMHREEIEYVKETYETNWMSTVGKKLKEMNISHTPTPIDRKPIVLTI